MTGAWAVSRTSVWPSSTSDARRRRGGFTIIELVIAMFLITAGLLGAAGLMATSQRYQRRAAAREQMAALAEGMFDQLRMYQSAPVASGLRARLNVGGSLTTSTSGYADSLTAADGRSYRRRWQIENGAAGTRQVTLRVEARFIDPSAPPPIQFQSLVFIH
jgi:Tfp pilus assembly protein PilV